MTFRGTDNTCRGLQTSSSLSGSLWVTNSKSREPNLQDHSHMRRRENNKYATYTVLKGFGLKGWKCSYEAYVNYSKVKPIAKRTDSCSFMATYMNSLFRTGVPPATHLMKTGFLKEQLFNIEMLQMSCVSNCNVY